MDYVFCCLLHRQCNLSFIANKRADAIGSIGVMVSLLIFLVFMKNKVLLITEYATQSTENKAFEELLKNPELYIKTELDPIAEDFINDIKAVRPGVDASVLKEEHGTLKSH
jgi:ClpP class serine protease